MADELLKAKEIASSRRSLLSSFKRFKNSFFCRHEWSPKEFSRPDGKAPGRECAHCHRTEIYDDMFGEWVRLS